MYLIILVCKIHNHNDLICSFYLYDQLLNLNNIFFSKVFCKYYCSSSFSFQVMHGSRNNNGRVSSFLKIYSSLFNRIEISMNSKIEILYDFTNLLTKVHLKKLPLLLIKNSFFPSFEMNSASEWYLHVQGRFSTRQ